uniref:Uncharacterized protein n=1 Tax=Candidatus Kentrum sp. FW TaxID=2126338 RepID=A0A450SDD9_9GAMM|nr:MAG: hypothetical protein BECKFW1821A_GA0114235_100829 [Candidatus Kentron sp. FW]VFJ50554.1 MAG: hypothetical protein BECKFW1821B_GA0114236_100723 [Candidatus Kentron sp. FW]
MHESATGKAESVFCKTGHVGNAITPEYESPILMWSRLGKRIIFSAPEPIEEPVNRAFWDTFQIGTGIRE